MNINYDIIGIDNGHVVTQSNYHGLNLIQFMSWPADSPYLGPNTVAVWRIKYK